MIQLDEPWLRNDPEGGPADRGRGDRPRPRGAVGHHRGASVLRVRRAGWRQEANRYDFLGELSDSIAQQISVEAAQPKLDLGQLSELSPKVVVLGVLDLGDASGRERRAPWPTRIRAALAHVPAERLVPAPDCGMKYLPRELAFAKLRALSAGAALVRREIS